MSRRIDDAIEMQLTFCPICGEHLDTNPMTFSKYCKVHGNFIVHNSVASFYVVMFGGESMWR